MPTYCSIALRSIEELQDELKYLRKVPAVTARTRQYYVDGYFEGGRWSDEAWELVRQILAVSRLSKAAFSNFGEGMPPNTLGNFVTQLRLLHTPLICVSDALQFSGQSIRELEIAYLEVGNANATQLADILALSRLEKLVLREVTLIEDAPSILAKGLAACKGSLKSLNMNDFACDVRDQLNTIGDSDGSETVMAGLVALLSGDDCCLTDLELYKTRFGDKSMIALASALRLNRSIQTLTIVVYGDFGDTSIPALASALSQHCSLRRLEIGCRFVTERGWTTLFVDGVLRSQVLEQLKFIWYAGDLDFMASALASPFNRNDHLRSIDTTTDSRRANPVAWRTIECFLDLNSWRARVALLSKQSRELPLSLWPLVMERLQHIKFSLSYRLDSERPTDEQKASRLFFTLREAASVIFP